MLSMIGHPSGDKPQMDVCQAVRPTDSDPRRPWCRRRIRIDPGRRDVGLAQARARRRGRLNRLNSNSAPRSSASAARNGSVMMSSTKPMIIAMTANIDDSINHNYPPGAIYSWPLSSEPQRQADGKHLGWILETDPNDVRRPEGLSPCLAGFMRPATRSLWDRNGCLTARHLGDAAVGRTAGFFAGGEYPRSAHRRTLRTVRSDWSRSWPGR